MIFFTIIVIIVEISPVNILDIFHVILPRRSRSIAMKQQSSWRPLTGEERSILKESIMENGQGKKQRKIKDPAQDGE